MGKMKIAFTTCVRLGLDCIEEILNIGGNIDLLVTLKDEKARNKSGRIYLDGTAEKYNIPLLKINNINDEETIKAVREKEIDWLFVIGWSQIVKKELLSVPKKGCVGIHPTLLPEGRGRAAIPWAILKGLKKTGVTMFKLDEGVDTGDILAQLEIPLDGNITATELYEKVEKAHVQLIRDNWADIINDTIKPIKQDETKATVWEGRKPEDGELSHAMTMEEASRMVRAVTRPYPGAFYIEDGRKVTVWSARTTMQITGNDEGELPPYKLADGYLLPIDYETKNTGNTEAEQA